MMSLHAQVMRVMFERFGDCELWEDYVKRRLIRLNLAEEVR